MSTASTPNGQTQGQGAPWMQVLGLLSVAVLAAETAERSGLSDRVARLYPSLPPLPTLAFFSVPLVYLVFRSGSAAVRWGSRLARRNPTMAAAVTMAAVGVGLVAVRGEASPSSPARRAGPATYYDIPGDASILDKHVTLPPGTSVAGGTTQYKVFGLRNKGTTDWVGRWLCRDDPAMNTEDNLRTPDCVPVPATRAGQTVDVGVRVSVANRDVNLVATFKMSDGVGWYYRKAAPVRIELNVYRR